MDLIEQLTTLEREIKKNNSLQLGILSQIENISGIRNKHSEIDAKTRVLPMDTVVSSTDLDLEQNDISEKIQNEKKILGDRIDNLQAADYAEEDVNKKEMLTIKDKRKAQKMTEEKRNLFVKETLDKNADIVRNNIQNSIGNLEKNQEIINKTREQNTSKIPELIQESKFPEIVEMQKKLAKKCARKVKLARGIDISKKINREISTRKKYTNKYTKLVMKELLTIRKKITKKNKALAKLINEL
jgi:hypothetical protein